LTPRALLKQVLALRGAARSLAEQADALVECLAPEQQAPKDQTGPRYLGDDEPTEPEPEEQDG
jgi:hypothetical protein